MLFQESNIGNLKLKNRFVRSATWENMATENGKVTDKLIKMYEDLAKGGVGLIITGYAYITKEEQPAGKMLGIYDDSFIEEYKPLVKVIEDNGAKGIMQIVYGGSQTSFNLGEREILGPSAVPDILTKVTPKEMTKEEIDYIVKSFGKAAKRVKEAGFHGVQIHGAHGYLLSKFLDPYHNRRSDEYGGSIENRAKIVFQVYDEVRNQVGKDYPVLIKINCKDFGYDGVKFSEVLWVCKELENRGIDAIELSGGGYREKIEPQEEGLSKLNGDAYYSSYGQELSKAINIPVILVGNLRTLEEIESLYENTNIKFFSMCRPFIRESDIVNRWENKSRDKSKCIDCNKCRSDEGVICIFNRKK
ncbi:NADH:flavin oxidoreductase [Clostridium hydrogeniformans]|uniref:NADH:flavin oxidoreductase n=1 Tax=Clostridium hydrogeniformans TaxID=349933 RepID=UPI000B25167E|nr:NADH:flavin oxidoreductase [Clostridium hydrogeniformans]